VKKRVEIENMAEILEIDDKYKDSQIDTITKSLKESKIVIMPTDTIYGFSCIKESETKLREIKKRDSKPFIYLISNYDMLTKFEIDIETHKAILEKNWHNMITFILPTKKNEKVAIRMPNNPILLKIIDIVGEPIVSTSVNYSGEPIITSIDDIIYEFHNKVDLIVVDRSFLGEKVSTIVDLTEDNYKIIRDGATKFII
jgi:L-threonylcarbamoyladenylate synthase